MNQELWDEAVECVGTCMDSVLPDWMGFSSTLVSMGTDGLRLEGALLPLRPLPFGIVVVAIFVIFGALFIVL